MIDLLKLGTVTSGFGKRKSPTAGASSNHKGIDIVLNDENIPAVTDGVVKKVGHSDSAGYYITTKNVDGTESTYMHLKYLPSFSAGDTVQTGETIGIMGNTGISTGTHLHFQVEKNGEYLDPVEYMESGYAYAYGIEDNTGIKGVILSILGNLIQFVAVILVLVLAAYLFLKAFDITII